MPAPRRAVIPLGIVLAWAVGVVSALAPACFAVRKTIVAGLRTCRKDSSIEPTTGA